MLILHLFLFLEANGIPNGVQNGVENGFEEMNDISNGLLENAHSKQITVTADKLKAAVRYGRKTTSTVDGPKVDFLESLAAMVIKEGIVDAMSREK